MTNKNPTIDIAKGIAIILVVYGHVIEHSMTPLFFQNFFQNPVFKLIYTFHMPLFVFISGYLMAGSLSRHSIDDVFKSRFKSLFIPFVVLAALCAILTTVLNIVFGNHAARVDIVGDLANQLFFKPSVWFLLTLFALSSVLIYSVKLERRFGGIVFAGIYFLLMIIPYTNDGVLYYTKWFYLFYLAGYFFHRYHVKIPDPATITMIVLGSLALFTWMLTYWTTGDYIYINKMNFVSSHYIGELLRLMYRYLMGFLGIVLAFYLAACLLKTKMASFFELIGVYSMDIYIIQMLLVEGLYPRFISKTHIHLDLNSPHILYIIAPVITMFFIGICLLISRQWIRKNQLLNQLLLGGRT